MLQIYLIKLRHNESSQARHARAFQRHFAYVRYIELLLICPKNKKYMEIRIYTFIALIQQELSLYLLYLNDTRLPRINSSRRRHLVLKRGVARKK